ncbi:MAG: SEC-C domain-containing protein [Rhodocyclaceae bacterium]|nr:SEC-C domain-containing protein [Rhodocyclaceae bacterium]
MRKKTPEQICPCGSGIDYARCCGRFIDGGGAAPDAVTLMKSRYTAYVRAAQAYLLATWHPTTRPAELDLVTTSQPKWLGLSVLGQQVHDPDHASVEFVARYKISGRAARLHETSRFVREHGRWFYLDGEVRDTGSGA